MLLLIGCGSYDQGGNDINFNETSKRLSPTLVKGYIVYKDDY